ncbi:MAG: hypothetical protein ABIG56_04635 [Candidatus Omnitrophota bacterium]
MEESLKNRMILILVILSSILSIGMISSCNNAYRQRAAREKEMAVRIDLEEKMNKFLQETNMLNVNLKRLEKELEVEQLARKQAEATLSKSQGVNTILQNEIKKEIKLKETLEEDLKDALVTER